ncbi:MAG: TlpA family protein disulfide reductase [Nitrospirae bacterium]|nr:MAG: TlpA family protein disulfide reductase [Nitrospirota bacterium]
MKKIFSIIVIASLLIFASSCQKKEGEVEVAPPSKGDIAPDFTLKQINGKAVSLADYKGKVVLVEFWATWCPPCKELAPILNEIHKRYKDKGLVILALVSEDEGEEAITSFIKEQGITYTVVLADQQTTRRYGISGIPASFVINKEGRVVNMHMGNTQGIMQELAVEIEGLL